MLRKFKISIDGKKYLVEMEEIGGAPQAAPTVAPAPTPAPTPAPAATATLEPEPAPKPAPAPTPQGATNTEAMASPMPGTILRILVNVGDQVKANQPLIILEAMKMENEIVANKDGKITAIHVSPSQTVNAGDPLLTIA